MKLSNLIARIVTQRRAYVWLSVIAGAIVCLIIFVSRISLDSDVLNMLPDKFSSLQGLKIYDRAFEQTRELTFALHCQPDDVDKLEEFAPIFAEHLRKQPWAERVLAGSPMQTPDGIRDLQSIAVPRKYFANDSTGSVNKSKPAHRGRSSSSSSTRWD